MFDLDRAIEEWRQELTLTGTVSDDDAQELEEHLREIVTVFVGQGLTPQEAMAAGRVRLGHAPDLKGEFGKVNGSYIWRDRLLWMLVGYIGGSTIMAMATGISAFTGSASSLLGLGGSLAAMAATIVTIVCWSLVLLYVYRCCTSSGSPLPAERVSGRFLVGACLLLGLGRGLAPISNLVHVRAVAVSEYGTYSVGLKFGAAAVGLIVLTSCIALVLALQSYQRSRQVATS